MKKGLVTDTRPSTNTRIQPQEDQFLQAKEGANDRLASLQDIKSANASSTMTQSCQKEEKCSKWTNFQKVDQVLVHVMLLNYHILIIL